MKKTCSLFLLTAVLAISFCSQAQTINGSFMHNGLSRTYELYIPTSYNSNTPVPLVMNFHGFGGSGPQQRASTNFKPIADSANFIIVHPTGTPLAPIGLNHWNVGSWTASSTADDISFASALIDSIAANYNINMMRVYACGFSNGGFFSHKLGSELGHRFAAIASVSGTFSAQMKAAFNPSHTLPVMQIHGTTDGTVPYTGTASNGGMEAVDTVIKYWVDYNNCNPIPTITPLPDINTTDGSTVEHIVYAHSSNGTHVELLKITNGGHQWPGASGNMDINASLEIWKFFSRYTNTAVGIHNTIHSEPAYTLYPNPCFHKLFVQGDGSQATEYVVFSMLGQQMAHGKISAQQPAINISSLAEGHYLLKIKNQIYRFSKMD